MGAIGALRLVLAVYFVAVEQGDTSLIGATFVNESLHDARQLIPHASLTAGWRLDAP